MVNLDALLLLSSVDLILFGARILGLAPFSMASGGDSVTIVVLDSLGVGELVGFSHCDCLV